METKSLLFGIVGFFIGGLLVSVAATTFDKPATDMSEMTQQLESKSGDDYDSAFIANMIDHHQAAIDMSILSANNAKHDEIKRLSIDIINTQKQEINEMKHLQRKWGYSTYSPGHETRH